MKKGRGYLTEEERRDKVLKRVDREKFLEESYGENLDANKNRSMKVSIDGQVYESVSSASRLTGLNEASIHKSLKKLNHSSRSEMEFSIKTMRTYVFKKIK